MLDLKPIRIAGRSAKGRDGALARRNLPDRGRPRARALPLDLSRISRSGAAAGRGARGIRLCRRRSRRHPHDQSVQMADFGVRDFLLRRRAGAARLQAHAARTSGAAGALEGARADRGIPALARDLPGRKHFGRAAVETGAGDRSSRGRRSRGRAAMGGVSRRSASRNFARASARIRPASSIRRAPAAGPRAAC